MQLLKFFQVHTHAHRFLLLALLASSQIAQALPITDLYSHEVAVSGNSDAQRNEAFKEALAAVIVKVTGNRRWLENSAVRRAIANAQSYVEEIGYERRTVQIPFDDQALLEPFANGVNSGQQLSGRQPSGSQLPGSQQSNQDSPAPSEQGNDGSPQQSDSISNLDAVLDADSSSTALINSSATDPVNSLANRVTTRQQGFIKVTFATEVINELLENIGAPIWDRNRPSLLIWMALQDEQGERALLVADGSDKNQAIIDVISQFAASRGLPVIFPVLDFEDRRNLGVNQIWSLDEEAIRQASNRYGADSILSGRILFTVSDELVGLWQFIFQDTVEVFDGFDTDLEDYLNSPLDRVTQQLASHFAIVREDSGQQTLTLRVEGVKSLQSYTALTNYIQGLGLVENVSTSVIDGQGLELQLNILGDPQQLLELIALDRYLQAISSQGLDSRATLFYRWLR